MWEPGLAAAYSRALETYLQTLKEIGYDGPLTIEREIPQEPDRQKAEIGGAVSLLEELRAKVLG